MLVAKGLHKEFCVPAEKGKKGIVRAVNGVDLTLRSGEVYALVGESGSGKSTLAQLLMGLLPLTSGELLLDGESLSSLHGKEARRRFARMQMVLQDSKSALDPHFTVYESIAEPIRNLLRLSKKQEQALVDELMRHMELSTALLSRRAHELSGGQQKRVCIARAIAVSPRIILFDEAMNGLDVLVRKSILDLLKKLQREHGYIYLFITHDIDMALYIADHILVMKQGEIVERVHYNGEPQSFRHPYSKLLLKSILPETE